MQSSVLGIILTLLRLCEIFFTWAQQNKWMNEGADKAVAQAATALLQRTAYAQQLRKAKTQTASEEEINAILDEMGKEHAQSSTSKPPLPPSYPRNM